MSEWSMKRFWSQTGYSAHGGGYQITLDDRPVRTPAKSLLVVPSEAIATHIAAEWDAQEDAVDPTTMPWTRSSNAAIDKVAVQRGEVAAHLAEYAGTDLLCYRADGPESLIERQQVSWDPVLRWASETHGIQLSVTAGIMPVVQSEEVTAQTHDAMSRMSDFQLTGFYDLVTLSGSFLLALAVTENYLPAEAVWGLSRLDDEWQIEQWGEDEEAREMTEIKRSAFLHAAVFFQAA